MKPNLDSYREQRDRFISQLVETLSNDERFVAGWLTGSLSRNEADSLSDVDISLVISEDYNASLCTILEPVSHQTTQERFSLFSQFGTPALIHENNNNAPPGGTFTFVMYKDSAIMIDWILIPQAKAIRPYSSKLFFDKIGIPVSSPPTPEDLEQSKKAVAEQWAFFWMMTAITIKYIIRGDGVFAARWIENLHSLIEDMESRIKREPLRHVRGSVSQLQSTSEKQLQSIRVLYQRMQKLKPAVTGFIDSEPFMPIAEIETLIHLANK